MSLTAVLITTDGDILRVGVDEHSLALPHWEILEVPRLSDRFSHTPNVPLIARVTDAVERNELATRLYAPADLRHAHWLAGDVFIIGQDDEGNPASVDMEVTPESITELVQLFADH